MFRHMFVLALAISATVACKPLDFKRCTDADLVRYQHEPDPVWACLTDPKGSTLGLNSSNYPRDVPLPPDERLSPQNQALL